MADTQGFTSEDLGDVIMAGNDVAMQWYAMTHQTQVPTRSPGIYTPLPGGGSVAIDPKTVVLLILGVIAIFVFAK
jgi:hypothetical protein